MAVDALAGLVEAIERLGVVDHESLDDAALHELVVGLGPLAARLQAQWCRFAHAWDVRQVWADNGSRSPSARLARETGMRQVEAKALVRRGRQMTTMPATAAAYEAGEITGAHVDLIGSCDRPWRNASFAESEELLLNNCKTAWFDNAVTATRYWQMMADRDGDDVDAHQKAKEGRHLSASTGWRGEVVLNGTLDPVAGEIFMTQLGRICEELRLQDQRDGLERTVTQRRADALVEMAMRSATAPADGIRPRPLFTVTIGIDHFSWICQTAAGTVIEPGLLMPLLWDAEIERIVYDPPQRKIEASYRRDFVGAMRRIIEIRDVHCQHHAGCDEPASRCDVDHVVPHSCGGITCICNGQLLCTYHNRIVKAEHDRRLALTKKQSRAVAFAPPNPHRDRPCWYVTEREDAGAPPPRAPPIAS